MVESRLNRPRACFPTLDRHLLSSGTRNVPSFRVEVEIFTVVGSKSHTKRDTRNFRFVLQISYDISKLSKPSKSGEFALSPERESEREIREKRVLAVRSALFVRDRRARRRGDHRRRARVGEFAGLIGS